MPFTGRNPHNDVVRRKIIRLRLNEETVRQIDELAAEAASPNAVVVNAVHEAYQRLIENQTPHEVRT